MTGDDAAPTGITIEGSEAVATSTLSGTDLDYFTVPITQGASAAATAATTTAMSTAKSSGSTGGTAGLDVRTSTLALIGAAALAAVMI